MDAGSTITPQAPLRASVVFGASGLRTVGSARFSSTDSGTTEKQCELSSQSSRNVMSCRDGIQRGWSGECLPPSRRRDRHLLTSPLHPY